MIYRVGKTVIWFAIAFGLAACPAERFRHEKYVCKSVSFDLDSIIVNDTDIGGEVKIIGYGKDQCLSPASIHLPPPRFAPVLLRGSFAYHH